MDCSRLEGSGVVGEKMEKSRCLLGQVGRKGPSADLESSENVSISSAQTGVAVGIGSNSLESLERGKMSFGRINKGEG